ncbi:hypothetical protein RGQ29_001131 [Quercus rubra]|uniref:Uncharacterized protein n=1 Tax=Quercus rubra TaxID=3512 RepID=A0AAN7G8A1_QUERU|nr:hypothetical protein RGQ29_001131 [Quercus rubra]
MSKLPSLTSIIFQPVKQKLSSPLHFPKIIGTVQTTLNAGTIFVTLFPNFNMSLKDPHLCDALKVQVQITGASQVQDTFAVTLHYQLAYRLQNHAFDMAVPDIAQSNDALLIQVDPGITPMCTFVPRQLDKDQMMSLFPESWITKYEMLHQATKPIQSKNPLFIRKENGEVETKFLMAPSEKKDVTVFPTQIVMLQPVSYVNEDGLQIRGFGKDGKPCYEGKSPSGHIWWDVCNCVDCQKESLEEDRPKRKKKTSQQKLKERYEAGDPEVDLLGEPFGRFDYYVSSAEAALNWQAENAVAQNKVLSKILDNQQKMAEAVNHTFSSSNTLIEDLKEKIKAIEKELETIASTVKDLSVSFPLIGQKEKEKKQLLLQLQSMQGSQKEAAQALPMHV